MRFSFLTLFLSCLVLVVSCGTSSKNKKSPKEKKADIFYAYGTKSLVEKDYTNALVNLKKAANLNPGAPRVHNNLGMAYYFKKDVNKALFHLNKALEIDPKHSETRNNLAGVLTRLKKTNQARTHYNKILEDLEYKGQFRTYYNLGVLDLMDGKDIYAYQNFKKSLNDNSEYCPAHFQMGLISFKKHRYQQALESFRKASLGTCVDQPAPHYHQALSLMQLQKNDKALIKFKEIKERFPESRFAILSSRKLRTIEIRSKRSKLSRK
jgi:Tfp pilus assembly protein PilF